MKLKSLLALLMYYHKWVIRLTETLQMTLGRFFLKCGRRLYCGGQELLP